jgi:predicted tellurium resistance membrane protein TerC
VGWISSAENWTALVTLTVLEIVLGIDNLVFIGILSNTLPAGASERARRYGIALAVITRVLLLLSLSWIMRLTAPLFTAFGRDFSSRDLILLMGGLFLIWKSVHEIHQRLEGDPAVQQTANRNLNMRAVVTQIVLLDIVFSVDSVITAVGMANQIAIMFVAVILAAAVMMFAAGPVSAFVERRPTVKMLAVSFLLLIGVSLIAEGLGQDIPKGYIYFALAFSAFLEFLNLRTRKASKQAIGEQQ